MTPEEIEKQRDEETAKDQAQASDGNRLEEFLADPAIQAALKRMEKECFQAFLAADDDAKRQNAWAKSAVMQDFLAELQGIKGRKAAAESRIRSRDAADARAQRTTRK